MNTGDLTLWPFYWRATELFPEKEIVSRTSSGVSRYTYEAFGERVARMARGLRRLGVDEGSRVATIGWNHHRHLELYYAVPLLGAQLHTINAVLPDHHTEYIINDAEDDIIFADPGEPIERLERIQDGINDPPTVIRMGDDGREQDSPLVKREYESLIEDAAPLEDWPALSEDLAAGMCYTSGTTGMPKGVEYSQKMIYSHALMTMTPSALNITEQDVVLPVVPMFHVNSWEFPYAVTMAGATQVYPGPSPSAADLAGLIEDEGVTLTAGVPTVWINLLEYLDEHDANISSLERIIVGGSAVPSSVMERFDGEYDVTIEQAWGMTETMSIGSVSRPKSHMQDRTSEEEYRIRAKQGLLSPGLEMRVVKDGAEVAWDGESAGELWVRGPTVVDSYYNRPEASAADFADGWLKTGDIVTVDESGYIEVVDRKKDVIKSGGEWISSIELENELMAHEAVVEAAVIAVDHDRWQERPLACVVVDESTDIDAETLRDWLSDRFERWQLPDDVVFVDEIPKTATGKFDKKQIRGTIDSPELRWTPGE